MYIKYMQFVLNTLLEKTDVEQENIIPIDTVIENVTDFSLRPAITFGSNTDWTNKRREEDWILTLQLFCPHDSYFDIRGIAGDIRNAVIQYCSSKTINDVIYTANEVSLQTSFTTDYSSIIIRIYVNSKESM